jgi:hypothetical protein
LRLAPGPERPQHVAGADPRAHQLGVVPEPIAHQAVEQSDLLGDLRGDGIEIGAGSHMIAPARPRRFQSFLELPQGGSEIIEQAHRQPQAHEQVPMRGCLLQHHAGRREEGLVTGVGGRQPELLRQIGVLLRSHGAQPYEKPEELLDLATQLLALHGGRSRRDDPRSLLGGAVPVRA